MPSADTAEARLQERERSNRLAVRADEKEGGSRLQTVNPYTSAVK